MFAGLAVLEAAVGELRKVLPTLLAPLRVMLEEISRTKPPSGRLHPMRGGLASGSRKRSAARGGKLCGRACSSERALRIISVSLFAKFCKLTAT